MLYFLFFFFFLILIYFAVLFLISLWRGCDRHEASLILHQFLSGTQPYHLYLDQWFIGESWSNIKTIIGEQSFSDLSALSNSFRLFFFSSDSADQLPFVAFTVICKDENDKQRLESILSALAKRYLDINDLSRIVVVDWLEHTELHYPILQIRYAETEKQLRMIRRIIEQKNEIISSRHQSLADDEECDISE